MMPVEEFARLSAHIDLGLTAPRELLRSAGLDRSAWLAVMEHWNTIFSQGPDGDLPERFSSTYTATRRALLEAGPAPTRTQAAKRFLSPSPQSWREEAAAVPLSPSDVAFALVADGASRPGAYEFPDLEQTAPPCKSAGVVLPFVARAVALTGGGTPLERDVTSEDPLETTAAMPVRLPDQPALPFARRSAAAPATDVPFAAVVATMADPRAAVPPFPSSAALSTEDARSAALADATAAPFSQPAGPPLPFAPLPALTGKRLLRFDSATGAPLATPIWVDDTSHPDRKRP
jgi:hypothetical protein